ncbi:MAG TPA: transcription-repair coupling factor, partial [Gammaproteobacteria bacterium]|nr:transcription-repair coupling factor [Gammaproteobacteria bacterium]
MYGSAQSLALIELAKTKQQVILVIADDIKDYNKIYNSLNFFNQDLTILRFDNWEVLAFDHFSPHPDITSNRLSTLYKLQDLKRGIVITTLESLSQRLCPLEYVNSYSFELNCGDDLNLESFTKNLHKIGYNRVNSVMEHGEYSVKGSLIDLYPMGSRLPYRVDLFDQEIESIRTFDPTT